MHHSTLRRAIVRLGRNMRLCLSALALALALGTAIVPSPPPTSDDKVPEVDKSIHTPMVNWNS